MAIDTSKILTAVSYNGVNLQFPGLPEEKDVNFYDYDGTLVDSYTAEDFLELTALPANPSHTGLTAQGWNWTLSNAKTQVQAFKMCDIGQNYITSDGKTRIHISLMGGRLSPYLGLCVNGSVDIDWGDGSAHSTLTGSSLSTLLQTPHVYSQSGDYTIILTITGSAKILGNDNDGGSLLIYKGTTGDENSVYRSSINEVNLGNNISLGEYGFAGINAKISIPTSITSFENYSFREANIKCVVIPNATTTIPSYMFISFYGEHTILPYGITTIKSYCWQNSNIKRIIVPNSVTSMEFSAFYQCKLLRIALLSNNISTLRDNTFYNCFGLKKSNIPENSTATANAMFSSCKSLSNMEIPQGVTSIKVNRFIIVLGLGKLSFWAQHHQQHKIQLCLSFCQLTAKS